MSGKHHLNPVEYFIRDKSNPKKIRKSILFNQLGYLQEAGSCSIFSIKQLVNGMVGFETASLHSEFLQGNTGLAHLQQVNDKIASLAMELAAIYLLERKQVKAKMNDIFATFTQKIASMPNHSSQAVNTAKKLLAEIALAKDEYFRAIDLDILKEKIIKAGSDFVQKCKNSIDKALPVLEKNLSWGDYLQNLLKVMANLVISFAAKITGSRYKLFTLNEASTVGDVNTTKQDIESNLYTPK